MPKILAELRALAGFSLPERQVSSAETVDPTKYVMYMLDATGGTFNLGLPTLTTTNAFGPIVFFKKTDATGAKVFLLPSGTDTIDGAASYYLELPKQVLGLYGDAPHGVWCIIGERGGGGVVASVTASSPLGSSGGPNPNIAIGFQSNNVVLAGPSSAGSGAPTFRSLVAADMAVQSAHAALIGPLSGSPAAPTFRALTDTDLPASVVINPMTTLGAILAGGIGGAPTSFPIGTVRQSLVSDNIPNLAWGWPSPPPPVTEIADFAIVSTDPHGIVHRCDTSGLFGNMQANPDTVSSFTDGHEVTFVLTNAAYGLDINGNHGDPIMLASGAVSTATLVTLGQSLTLRADPAAGVWWVFASHGI
jgi:hypothetical protein